MIQTVKYKNDENFVELTGTIKNLPDYCKYIPRPLLAFDLVSYRKVKNEGDEPSFDENRIIVFDDEEFHTRFQNGERIRIKGELQSRNFTRDTHEIDELIVLSIKNYVEIFGEFPTKTDPKGKIRQPIDWSKLLQMGLIPAVPEDSMYLADGTKSKSKDAPFVYRIDENAEVYKETEHVAYEVVVKKFEKLEEELDLLVGDKNKIVLTGKVTKQPYFDYLGSETKIPFCSFNICTKSKFFEDRVFYNNVITWSHLAEEAFENIQRESLIKIVGRLQSRSYQKELTRRWKTPSGKRKKKVITLDLTTREVSASKILKVEKVEKKENKKEEN